MRSTKETTMIKRSNNYLATFKSVSDDGHGMVWHGKVIEAFNYDEARDKALDVANAERKLMYCTVQRLLRPEANKYLIKSGRDLFLLDRPGVMPVA